MIKNIVIIRCENQNEKEHYYIPKIEGNYFDPLII